MSSPYEELRATNASVLTRISVLQAEAETRERELADERYRVERVSRQFEYCRASHERLRGRLEARNGEIARLRDQGRIREADVQGLVAEVARLQWKEYGHSVCVHCNQDENAEAKDREVAQTIIDLHEQTIGDFVHAAAKHEAELAREYRRRRILEEKVSEYEGHLTAVADLLGVLETELKGPVAESDIFQAALRTALERMGG